MLKREYGQCQLSVPSSSVAELDGHAVGVQDAT